jgi:sigma-B regulation protein RsbU (phosphoserine phosphatase)
MLAGDGMNLFRLDENNYALIMVNVGSSGDASSYLLASLARKLVPVPGQPGILKLLSRVAQGYELVPPERVLTLLNSEFSIDLGNNKTFSVFYGIINLAESMLYYASAGNPVPIVVRQNGSLASLAGPEKPIGETADYKYKRQQVQLHNADRLCLFSEGLSNMPDHSGEPFAKRRLQEHVLRAHDSDLEAFVEYIFKTAMEWGSIDKTGQDVSLLAVEIYGAKNNGAS